MHSHEISFDCRYFTGDRPCLWHKKEGVLCRCDHYSGVDQRILIIKLDAAGDVLRTTCILPALSAAYPQAAISWVTRAEAKPLLELNSYLSETIIYGPDVFAHLLSRRFDRVINLDAGKISSGLAAAARSSSKDGFTLDEYGAVRPSNAAARQWLEMGVFDDLKRAGTLSYQDIMMEILGFGGLTHRYVLELNESEILAGRKHLETLGVRFDRPIIGLNTGGGRRWPQKQWTQRKYAILAERLHSRSPVNLLLLGGPEEQIRNSELKANTRAPLIDAGCDNSLRHFAAIISQCDLVVTGDTLALHIALALGRRVVVMFGPTSHSEIELYGLGEKIIPEMDCLVCYKTDCDLDPNCMDLISVEAVFEAVTRQMAYALPKERA
jgi:ADP-heptose:LPS heptosyltransferase